jgi:hypothetical protein
MVESSNRKWSIIPAPLRSMVVITASLIVFGCGQSVDSVTAKNAKFFQTADPNLRLDWETATAAVKTNGYASAILTLRRLQLQTLTAEQRSAVERTLSLVSDKLYAAADKGDAAAAQNLQQLKKALGR